MFRVTGVMLCVHSAERWLSGRKHRFAKPARGKPLRGFESLSLRHSFFLPLKFFAIEMDFFHVVPLVGNGGRIRRPPYPLRPARCRCQVRIGGLAGLSGKRGPVGMRAAEIRGVFPLFCGKTPSHFRFPSPVPSQCGFARECRTPEYVEAPTVRGETRHCVPLSLPRTPLLPAFCCAADCRQVLYCLSISDGLWEQRGQRRERNSRNGTAFSRAQARSAPRAHVRGLLCGTQSSKEQLRRSRTESSGAPPAIEELAGEARQVRPAGPRADQYQPGSDFSRAQEVWRATGPPAPTTNIPARKSCISPPLPTAHHRSRNFPPRHCLLPSKRSEGRPALQLPRASNPRISSAYVS